MPHNSQFAGDYKFPPGRPPINKDISRPDQTAAINRAFAAWGDDLPAGGAVDLEASSKALQNLLRHPTAAVNPICPAQLQPFMEMDPTQALCEPASFLDPEHIVHSIDCRDAPPDDLQKVRLLPKRGMNRRLGGGTTVMDLPSVLNNSQASRVSTGTSDEMGATGGSIPLVPPHMAAAPRQVPLLRLIPSMEETVLPAAAKPNPVVYRRYTSEPCHYAQRRQPETGDALPGKNADLKIPYRTPVEVTDINLLLNGQAWIENKEAYLHKRIERVIWLWTVPWDTVVRDRRLLQEVPPDPRVQVMADGISATPARRPLPRICDIGCDAPSGAASDGNNVGDMRHRQVWEGTRAITAAQVSSEDGPDLREWPELAKDAERQVKPAEPQVSTLPPLRPDQATQPCMSKPESSGEMLTAASVRLDQTLLSAPPRRRRGGRRGRAHSPLAPATMGSGEGGVYSRGVQVALPWAEPVATVNVSAAAATSRRPRLREEDSEAALRTAMDRGSTVPVHASNMARHLARQVPGRGMGGSYEPVGLNVEGDSLAGFVATLSERREFLIDKADRVRAVSTEGLRVSICRGQKGRLVGEGSGLPGQRLHPATGIRSPKLGTREMTGIADELVCMGPVGTVSTRFPTQAESRYHGPESPAGRRRSRIQRGRRGRRNRGRHVKEGHGLSRDSGQGELDEARMAGCQCLLDCGSTDSVAQLEGTDPGAVAARPLATDDLDQAVGRFAPRNPSSRSASQRSGQGLAARWGKREAKMPETSESLGDSPRKDAGILPAVIGSGDDAPRTVGEASSGPGSGKGQWESGPVPGSIDARLVGCGGQMSLEIKREDWSMMQDLGLGSHSDLVVAFAWRRCSDPSPGRNHKRLPTIHLVSHEAVDIPKGCWPTSWEGLVEHVEMGGYFRKVGAMRGGMDPAIAQQLSLIDFRGTDWAELDRNLARVRAGEAIPPEQLTDNMRVAQLLSGCTPLQQWDPLATYLAALPEEVRRGLIISPARLAALWAILSTRPRTEQSEPPGWLPSAPFAEIQFHHLSPSDFVPDPHRANDLRGQILDGIVNRLLCVAPEIKQHPNYRLQDLRSDLRVGLNLKNLQTETCLFSATMVLPSGPWLSEFYRGVKSLGGRSFCTIAPIDLHIETELSNSDQQVLRAIRSALGVDHAPFRLMLDEALSSAFRCDVRSRDETTRYISTGGKGGKGTMVHFSPESPDSRLLTTMDATSLILARRASNSIPLLLGPITVSITIMRCPQQALQNALQPRVPAAIRLRQPGTVIDSPVVLMGPLPKGSIPARTVRSGAMMAELRRDMNTVCRAELQTKDVRLVGRYGKGKDHTPMFLYMEFGSAEAANAFGTQGDQRVPPEFGRLLVSLWGDKAFQIPFWSCNLLAECLATADERTLRALMSHGQAHACPLPPPVHPPPPLPPPPGSGADGSVADGSGSAASGPDNPGNAQH